LPAENPETRGIGEKIHKQATNDTDNTNAYKSVLGTFCYFVT